MLVQVCHQSLGDGFVLTFSVDYFNVDLLFRAGSLSF